MKTDTIIDNFNRKLAQLSFDSPVTHVYNPLQYARNGHDLYYRKYGKSPKKVVLVGMNPGPWGMAQTGVPFGEIEAVRDWMGITAAIRKPENEHTKRPVQGFACKRSEVSGKRLWGWAKERFNTPEAFFKDFFVANYCPLMFMEFSGRNRTPDKLKKQEREALFAICDQHLRELAPILSPQFVIGIGAFAAQRIKFALAESDVTIGQITHPSPANPKANKGWTPLVEKELRDIGVTA